MKKLVLLALILMVGFSVNIKAETIGVVDLQRFLLAMMKQIKLEKILKKTKRIRDELEKQKTLEKAQQDNKKPEDIQKLVEELGRTSA